MYPEYTPATHAGQVVYHSESFQPEEYNNLSPGEHLAITNTTLKRKSTEPTASVSCVYDCKKVPNSGHCKNIYFFNFLNFIYVTH